MKIAIIGGIGSGKSEAAKIIESFGNKVFDADKIYAEIMEDKSYIATIDKAFPGAVIDGKIDRKILGSIVFNDKQMLEKLNLIAHPLVKDRIDELSNMFETIYVEVPVFVGSILQDYFDKVILITSDTKYRIQRIIKRSGYDKEYAKKIILSQPSDDTLQKYADIIVINNKDLIHLRQQLAKLI